MEEDSTMHISPIYKEIIDFLAAGTTPQNLVDFSPSEEAKNELLI